MTSATLTALVEQVESLVANPATTPTPTGDKSLDRALTDLQVAYSNQEPLGDQLLSFWH